MSNRLFIICFYLFAVELNCQVIHTDSSDTNHIKRDNTTYQGQDTTTNLNKLSNNISVENTFLFPEDLFLLRLHSPYGNISGCQSSLSTLSLTSSIEYRLSENNKDLCNYLNNVYQQSRPTKLQEVLGMVDFSGAFLLAGYHVWKTYIKKENK